MSTLTIRKFPDSVRVALKVRAKQNDRSMEEEARLLLIEQLMGEAKSKQTGFGDALAAIGAKYGVTAEEVKQIEAARWGELAVPMNLDNINVAE